MSQAKTFVLIFDELHWYGMGNFWNESAPIAKTIIGNDRNTLTDIQNKVQADNIMNSIKTGWQEEGNSFHLITLIATFTCSLMIIIYNPESTTLPFLSVPSFTSLHASFTSRGTFIVTRSHLFVLGAGVESAWLVSFLIFSRFFCSSFLGKVVAVILFILFLLFSFQ